MLTRIATFPVIADERLSRFGVTFCWLAAIVTAVLGYRYVGGLGLPPHQHLLGLAVLLILCLAVGAIGMLAHVHTLLKAMHDGRAPGGR